MHIHLNRDLQFLPSQYDLCEVGKDDYPWAIEMNTTFCRVIPTVTFFVIVFDISSGSIYGVCVCVFSDILFWHSI